MAPTKRKNESQDSQHGQSQVSLKSNDSAQPQSPAVPFRRRNLELRCNMTTANEEMKETPEESQTSKASEDTFPDPLPPYDDDSPLKHQTLNYRTLPDNSAEPVSPLAPNEWKCGKPHRDGYFATYFKHSCRFARPPIDNSKNLDSLLQNRKKTEGQRLKGATIMIHDLTSSPWIAGLVGLKDTHQLLT